MQWRVLLRELKCLRDALQVSPASGAPQDWVGDLLVLAVPEDAFETTGRLRKSLALAWP